RQWRTSRANLLAGQLRRRLRSRGRRTCRRGGRGRRRAGPPRRWRVTIHVRGERHLGPQYALARLQTDQLELGDLHHTVESRDLLEELSDLVVATFGGDGDRNLGDVVLGLRLFRLEQRYPEARALRGLGHRTIEPGRLLLGGQLRL